MRRKELEWADDCIRPDDLVRWLAERGYRNVWLEDTDSGLVIHGVSLALDEGQLEVLVPEGWNNPGADYHGTKES